MGYKGSGDRTKKRDQFNDNHDKMKCEGEYCKHHVHRGMECWRCDEEVLKDIDRPEMLKYQSGG